MKTIIIIYLFFSLPLYSFDWRDLASKVVGESWVSRFFPESKVKSELKFPKLPAHTTANRPLENIKAQKMGSEQKEKYDIIFLKELYKVTRLGSLSNEDFSKWFNVLSQEGSREGVYHALVLDSTYYNLEQKKYPTSQELVNFIPPHLEKFTGNKIKPSQLKQLNFFLVKRVVIDKYLSVIDRFTNYEDLSSWYAFFSVDISKSFSNVFRSAIRKNIDLSTHKNWSLSVSKDLLKSEVYIKLHMVMNYLNYSDQKQ